MNEKIARPLMAKEVIQQSPNFYIPRKFLLEFGVKQAFFLSILILEEKQKDEFFPMPDTKWKEEYNFFSDYELRTLRKELSESKLIEYKRKFFDNTLVMHYKLNYENILKYI